MPKQISGFGSGDLPLVHQIRHHHRPIILRPCRAVPQLGDHFHLPRIISPTPLLNPLSGRPQRPVTQPPPLGIGRHIQDR